LRSANNLNLLPRKGEKKRGGRKTEKNEGWGEKGRGGASSIILKWNVLERGGEGMGRRKGGKRKKRMEGFRYFFAFLLRGKGEKKKKRGGEGDLGGRGGKGEKGGRESTGGNCV